MKRSYRKCAGPNFPRTPAILAGALPIRSIVYEYHPDAYLLWFTWGAFTGRLILMTLIGAVMALVAKRRELTATMTLALAEIFLWVVAFFFVLSRTGRPSLLLTLPYTLANCMSMVLGGAMVRTRRGAAPLPKSAP